MKTEVTINGKIHTLEDIIKTILDNTDVSEWQYLIEAGIMVLSWEKDCGINLELVYEVTNTSDIKKEAIRQITKRFEEGLIYKPQEWDRWVIKKAVSYRSNNATATCRRNIDELFAFCGSIEGHTFWYHLNRARRAISDKGINVYLYTRNDWTPNMLGQVSYEEVVELLKRGELELSDEWYDWIVKRQLNNGIKSYEPIDDLPEWDSLEEGYDFWNALHESSDSLMLIKAWDRYEKAIDYAPPVTYAEIDKAIKEGLIVYMEDGYETVILGRDKDTLDTIVTNVCRKTYKLNDVVRIGLEYGDISLKEQIQKHAPDVYAQRYSTTVSTGKSKPVALVDSGNSYEHPVSLEYALEQAKKELKETKAKLINKESHTLCPEREVKKKTKTDTIILNDNIIVEGSECIDKAFKNAKANIVINIIKV